MMAQQVTPWLSKMVWHSQQKIMSETLISLKTAQTAIKVKAKLLFTLLGSPVATL